MRFSNSTFGYGVYGGWTAFTTGSGLPGAPSEAWAFSNIAQDGAGIVGNSVASTGGSAITNWDVEYNTAANSTGSTVLTTAHPTVGPLVGLLAGTTYYARIRAKNVNGYGAYSSWHSFTTLSSALVNVAGVWKEATVYVNVAGVWKVATRYVAIDNGAGGVNWKQ